MTNLAYLITSTINANGEYVAVEQAHATLNKLYDRNENILADANIIKLYNYYKGLNIFNEVAIIIMDNKGNTLFDVMSHIDDSIEYADALDYTNPDADMDEYDLAISLADSFENKMIEDAELEYYGEE